MANLNLIVSAGIAISAFLGIGAASAADPPGQTYTEAAAIAPVTIYNWTGCYLGGYVGGARQSRQVNAYDPVSTGGVFPAGTYYYAPTATAANGGEFNYGMGSSVIGGGTLGCNWQGASPFVFGIEGEGGYLKVSGSRVSPYSFATRSNDTVASTRIGDWYAAVTGRFGAAWDRFLVYLKGGVGFSNINSSVIDACTAAPCTPGLLTATGNSNRPFWVGGVGVEYALNNNWSVKGEFLVLGMYQKYAVCGPGAAAAAGSTFCGLHNIEGVHTFKVGVNYYFNRLARTMIAAAAYDDWSGFYVGGNGGYGSSRKCFELPNPIRDNCITATGSLAGGQIGYRWQSGWWVFGLEAQSDWANLGGSVVSKLFPGNSNRARVDGMVLFAGQIGYAWNHALLYVKGGTAVTADRYNTFVTATNLLNGAASERRWGGTVGGGLEFDFAPNWSVALEYDHLFMGTRNFALSVPAIAPLAPIESIHQDVDLSTVRVNYRWGAPVIAKD
jgi:outer membrane immunogenic protein